MPVGNVGECTTSVQEELVVRGEECFDNFVGAQYPDVKKLLMIFPYYYWQCQRDNVDPVVTFDDRVAQHLEELFLQTNSFSESKVFQQPMTCFASLKTLVVHAGNNYGYNFYLPAAELLPALRNLKIWRYRTGTIPNPDVLESLELFDCRPSQYRCIGDVLHDDLHKDEGPVFQITFGKMMRLLKVTEWRNITVQELEKSSFSFTSVIQIPTSWGLDGHMSTTTSTVDFEGPKDCPASTHTVDLEKFPCLETLCVKEALPKLMRLVHAPLKKLSVVAAGSFVLVCGQIEELWLEFSQFNTNPAPEFHVIRATAIRHFYCDRPNMVVCLADGMTISAKPWPKPWPSGV